MSGHELAMALREAYLALHRRTEAAVSGTGVTADQFVLLVALAAGDALTQRELVERTSSDPNTLRAMLVLLEGRGLVVRRPNPTDRRARSVALTPRGRGVLRRAWRRSEALRDRLIGCLAEAEVKSLVGQLHRLADALRPEPGPSVEAGKRAALDEARS